MGWYRTGSAIYDEITGRRVAWCGFTARRGTSMRSTYEQLESALMLMERAPRLAKAFDAIVAELDAKEWDADTLEAIAAHVRAAGGVIRDVDDDDESEDDDNGSEPDLNAPDNEERAEQQAKIQRELKR